MRVHTHHSCETVGTSVLILIYQEKDKKESEAAVAEAAVQEELVQQSKGYLNPLSSILIQFRNFVLLP